MTTYGTNQLAGARVQTILNYGNWPASLRDIDAGLSTITGGQDISGTVLAQLEDVAQAELGLIFVDAYGNLVFRERYAALTRQASKTSQAKFTATSNDERPFMSVDLVHDDDLVKTQVDVSIKGGSTVTTVQDGAAAALYGIRSQSLTSLLLTNDTAAQDIGNMYLTLYSDAEFRPASISVNPEAKPATLYPQVLGRELRDRVTVEFTTPGGVVQSHDCWVDGIEHRITPGTWETSFALASSTVWDQMFVLDSSVSGVLDTNILGA